MSEHVQEQVQRAVDIATSSPATVGTVGTGVAAITTNLPLLIQILTALVLMAQLVAWCYRGYKWWKKKNNKD